MTVRQIIVLSSSIFLFAACGQSAQEESAASEADAAADAVASYDPAEEATLQIDIIKNGHGRAAVAGDLVTVHYTGWLFDENAADNRGEKFDSSVDRGEKFQFPLGAGRVIQGWDEGVAGMLIGEKRVLTIPSDMAYGPSGRGPIPPAATLIFEVELFNAESLSE